MFSLIQMYAPQSQAADPKLSSTSVVPNDFLLIIDGEQYPCHLTNLLMFSPTIQEHIRQNPNIKYFKIEKLKDPHHYMNVFLRLISGFSVEINVDNAFFLYELSKILQIKPLKDKTGEHCSIPFNISNILQIIQNLADHGLDVTNASNFVAENWEILKYKPEFLSLPLEVLDNVLKSQNFLPKTETDVFDWIHNLVVTRGREFSVLYDNCYLEKLTPPQIQVFIDDVSYDKIPDAVWEGIIERFKMPVDNTAKIDDSVPLQTVPTSTVPMQPMITPKPQVQMQPQFQPIIQNQNPIQAQPQLHVHTQPAPQVLSHKEEPDKLPPGTIRAVCDPDYALDGVISQLRDRFPDSWKRCLYVTGGGSKQAKILQIFNYDDTKGAWWDNYNGSGFAKGDAWLMVRFYNHKLRLTGYTLGSCAKARNSHQPRRWRVDGSLDGQHWSEVHSVANSMAMNSPNALVTFELPRATEPLSYFRWTMLENHTRGSVSNQYEFSVSALEMFGDLIPYQ